MFDKSKRVTAKPTKSDFVSSVTQTQNAFLFRGQEVDFPL